LNIFYISVPTISSDYESDEPSPLVNSNHSFLRSKSVNDPGAYPPDSIPPEPPINSIQEVSFKLSCIFI